MKDISYRKNLTAGKLFKILGKRLELTKVNGIIGHERLIKSPDISRPGMALTGYHHKFLHDRVQIFGETEISYLDSLSSERRKSSLESLFKFPLYCSIVTKGINPPEELIRLSESSSSALFSSTMDATPLIHELCNHLDLVFAP